MSSVEVVFHTFPLCSVDGKRVEDLQRVYSGHSTVAEMQAAHEAGIAPVGDVYARLQIDPSTVTKEQMRSELRYLFDDMLASDSFVDGLWSILERANA